MLKEKLEYDKYLKLKEINQKKVNTIASYRMVSFLIMLFSFILKYYYYPQLFQIIFLLSLLIFIFLVAIHNKYFTLYNYYDNYVEILNEYLKRENGSWKQFEDTATDFFNDKNLYLKDLDVLGDRSLFQYLSICKTLGGRRTLVEQLSNPKNKGLNLKEEQSAILELSNSIKFCIDFQIQIKHYEKKQIDLTKDFNSFQKTKNTTKRDLIIAFTTSLICIGILFLCILHIIPIKYFYGIFLFNYLISIAYTYIYKEEFSSITKFIQSYGKMISIPNLLIEQNFSSKKLKRIKEEMIKSKEGYKELSKIDTLNSLKDNILSGFFLNGFFCMNLILLYCHHNFLSKAFPKLKGTIQEIEELEAMISLAGLGILRKDYCIPSFQEEIGISFQELKHPLLEEKTCIPNDFHAKNGIQVITGSNMGGKTSFLRTIGINLILMNAGTFVCAKSFQSSYFKIVTSMRVADDIEKGISTFYGELLRIKEAITYVEKDNLMVLVDEIFKGTNYQDRIYGAKQVLKKLNTPKTLVFLTTHDFELCEESYVTNYHVKEEYKGDKILFDYKIRKGKCTSTNAKYLMKQLKIIDN